MKTWKLLVLIGTILICTCSLSGCWNYREVEQLAIVSAVTIDKEEGDKILVTVEIISVTESQQGSALEPVYIQASGNTFFDAVRKMVALQGKKLYWSHAKIVIISKDIAREEISSVLDFLNRDAEIREDMWVLISREEKANAIFFVKPETESSVAFQLDHALRAQRAIARYPAVPLYKFLDMLSSKETAVAIPTIRLINNRGKIGTYITGSAIIKGNKLIGYLDEQESKALLWIRDELKGGLFIVEKTGKSGINVSLEIFKNKTTLTPAIEDGKLIMKVKVRTDVTIGEIMGTENLINEQGRPILKKDAEMQVKVLLEKLIEKSQKEYKADIFNFGEIIKQRMPDVWKSIEKEWEEIYSDIEYKVDVEINIKGSGTIKTPLKVGY
ncbi:MAG TPA: Ger(x)C family spore germination protein [Candidatus Nitrosocosmicus sp.]|nr:Ger(x)C family spore germination protein [Candidatus Nitrosocosmicus sp.]